MSARAARAFACLVCAAACLLSCRAQEADRRILVHEGGIVRRSDFVRHLDTLAAGGVSTESPTVRRALLEAFLEERVLVLEARSRGLVAAGAAPVDEQRAVRRMLYEEVLATTTVTDKEVAAYYERHKDEFRVPETATVRQILVASINEARDIRRRLQHDPKNFEILARTHSRSPEAGQGGLLGSFARGELPPELDKVAFSLKPGSQVEIVATPYGHHVVRVDSRTPEHVPTLEECRDRVQAAALRQKQDDSVRKYIRALMAHAKVNYEAAEPPKNHQ